VISAATYLRNKGGETVVSANNNAINEGFREHDLDDHGIGD
jgi:hypothetical protein